MQRSLFKKEAFFFPQVHAGLYLRVPHLMKVCVQCERKEQPAGELEQIRWEESEERMAKRPEQSYSVRKGGGGGGRQNETRRSGGDAGNQYEIRAVTARKL